MDLNRCKQFGVSMLLLLSLAAASMAACICDHHDPVPSANSENCHGHSDAHSNLSTSAVEKSSDTVSAPGCLCSAVAKLAAKTDNIQLKKAAAGSNLVEIIREESLVPARSSAPSFFTTTPYLSDQFLSIAYSRGPPRS
jgi:hypothetical protein